MLTGGQRTRNDRSPHLEHGRRGKPNRDGAGGLQRGANAPSEVSNTT